MLHIPPGAWMVASESMVSTAFVPVDMQQLWSPAPLSVMNVSLYGEDGDLARDPSEEAVTYQIRYLIHGGATPEGVAHPSWGHGLAANYAELVDRVGKPSTWAGPTVATTVTRPDGVVLGGPIQLFVSPMTAESGPVARCVVTVTIPRGELPVVPPEEP